LANGFTEYMAPSGALLPRDVALPTLPDVATDRLAFAMHGLSAARVSADGAFLDVALAARASLRYPLELAAPLALSNRLPPRVSLAPAIYDIVASDDQVIIDFCCCFFVHTLNTSHHVILAIVVCNNKHVVVDF
jgi:hypothetical protein